MSLVCRLEDPCRQPAIETLDSKLELPDGQYTLASIIDVTERKRIDDDLRRSNADLEQFAYIASHDLQEPLRMVASYTDLLSQRCREQLHEKADKFIHYITDGEGSTFYFTLSAARGDAAGRQRAEASSAAD